MNRVHYKLTVVETRRFSQESVIWSNLHGDMQRWETTEVSLRDTLNTLSADSLVGLPYNIASYALLTHLIARECGLGVGELIWVGGDCHIYHNHLFAVDEILSRRSQDLCTLHIAQGKGLFTVTEDDLWIVNYKHHPAIKLPIAV